MPENFSSLQHLKESPQWVLLPSKKRDILFIATIAAIVVLCILSFNFTSLLP